MDILKINRGLVGNNSGFLNNFPTVRDMTQSILDGNVELLCFVDRVHHMVKVTKHSVTVFYYKNYTSKPEIHGTEIDKVLVGIADIPGYNPGVDTVYAYLSADYEALFTLVDKGDGNVETVFDGYQPSPISFWSVANLASLYLKDSSSRFSFVLAMVDGEVKKFTFASHFYQLLTPIVGMDLSYSSGQFIGFTDTEGPSRLFLMTMLFKMGFAITGNRTNVFFNLATKNSMDKMLDWLESNTKLKYTPYKEVPAFPLSNKVAGILFPSADSDTTDVKNSAEAARSFVPVMGISIQAMAESVTDFVKLVQSAAKVHLEGDDAFYIPLQATEAITKRFMLDFVSLLGVSDKEVYIIPNKACSAEVVAKVKSTYEEFFRNTPLTVRVQGEK